MYKLKIATAPEWVETVLANFDSFLLDHASCEKKASSMAMTFVSHYPDRTELVKTMTELAIEELNHFKEVVKIIYSRNLQLGADQKDPYVTELFKHTRKSSDFYFMDRMILASIVEARGHERFGLVAEALEPSPMQQFYKAITTSEGRHLNQFLDLACLYFPQSTVLERTEQLLSLETEIIARLPHRAALH